MSVRLAAMATTRSAAGHNALAHREGRKGLMVPGTSIDFFFLSETGSWRTQRAS